MFRHRGQFNGRPAVFHEDDGRGPLSGASALGTTSRVARKALNTCGDVVAEELRHYGRNHNHPGTHAVAGVPRGRRFQRGGGRSLLDRPSDGTTNLLDLATLLGPQLGGDHPRRVGRDIIKRSGGVVREVRGEMMVDDTFVMTRPLSAHEPL